jgi:hypothetical protein
MKNTVELTNEQTVNGFLNKILIKKGELSQDFKYITFCLKAVLNILEDEDSKLTSNLIKQVDYLVSELFILNNKCNEFVEEIEIIKQQLQAKV